MRCTLAVWIRLSLGSRVRDFRSRWKIDDSSKSKIIVHPHLLGCIMLQREFLFNPWDLRSSEQYLASASAQAHQKYVNTPLVVAEKHVFSSVTQNLKHSVLRWSLMKIRKIRKSMSIQCDLASSYPNREFPSNHHKFRLFQNLFSRICFSVFLTFMVCSSCI